MNKIHVLSQETINKIAAGEVVERPISVIKELVENAIDAKTTALTVEIEEGGLKLIRVTDNGIGMDKSDIQNAFLRHATSKIVDASDLDHIGSLGFRGEALASVAAVSRIECITKTRDNLTGIRYVIEGGIEKGLHEIGCPEGTTFLVNDLFYNVPARKKFLKTPKTEANYVADLMNRMALSHPGVSFKFVNNGKVKLHTSGNYSLKDCIYQVFGKEFALHSKVVDYSEGDLRISGFVGEPTLGRGNRQYEIYYVNGRYIKSKWIQRGIEVGAKDGMMINQFPFAVLFLTLPHDMVDVNVHPNKMEVRFHDELFIQEQVTKAIETALLYRVQIPTISLTEKEDKNIEKRIREEEKKILKDAPEPFEVNRLEKFKQQITKSSSHYMKPILEEIKTELIETGQREIEESETKQINTINEETIYVSKEQVSFPSLDTFLDEEHIKKHKVIGQIFNTYWIVQFNKEMYIIDQHAAHEKVLYEAWVKQIHEFSVSSQMLLEPKIYNLSEQEFELFSELKKGLSTLGFEAEEFGDTTIVVKSVPYLLNRPMNDLDFIVFFDQLVSGNKQLTGEEQYLDQLASIACKAAIKGNDKLSVVEYKRLVTDMLYLEDPYHCPHGRPTMVRMSQFELEKKFRRIV